MLLLFEKREELKEALGIDVDEDLDPVLVTALADEVKLLVKKRKALEKKRRRSQVEENELLKIIERQKEIRKSLQPNIKLEF